MKISKTVTTATPLPVVYDYLADFEHTETWDPGSVRTKRMVGDGGPGTRYHNTSRFLGRTTELEYVVTQLEPQRLVALRGENRTVVATDTMRFAATPQGGTQVHYEATFELKGWTRFVAPLLAPAFAKLGVDAERQLQETLDGLPTGSGA